MTANETQIELHRFSQKGVTNSSNQSPPSEANND